MQFFELADNIDKIIFLIIHNDSDHKVLDSIIPIFRNANTWIPLYIFILYFSIKVGNVKAWQFILFTILTFAASDIISAAVLKPMFARLRPCHDPELRSLIRNIIPCGGLYSLPSSHAANHFALACFWYRAIFIMTGKKWKWLWIWASVIGYSQIYVGKHYPSDILAGAILGCLIAMATADIFERIWKSPTGNNLRMMNFVGGKKNKKMNTQF